MSSLSPEGWTLLAGLAWLITFAIHSTVLLALALWITSRHRGRGLSWKERVWKSAVLAGVATSALQAGAGIRPAAGSWTLITGPTASAKPARSEPAETPIPLPAGGLPDTPLLERLTTSGVGTAVPPRPSARNSRRTVYVAGSVLGLWCVGAAALFLRLVLSMVRVYRRLGRGEAIEDGPVREILEELLARADVSRRIALCCTEGLAAPVTYGFFRPRICLPPRMLTSMDPAEQEAVIAHELAHAIRRDAAWLFLSRVFEAVFFFQPLLRIARRRIAEAAECCCDDWAVAHTGCRLAMARSLAEVAGWLVARPGAFGVPAMASNESQLALRVGRMLDEVHRPPADAARPWSPALGLLAVVPAAWLVPGVAAAPERSGFESADATQVNAASSTRMTAQAKAQERSELWTELAEIDRGLAWAGEELGLLERELEGKGWLEHFGQALEDARSHTQAIRRQREKLQRVLASLTDHPSNPNVIQPLMPEVSR